MFENCFDRLRQRSALVHNITNYVTVNDVEIGRASGRERV